ncbi:MAG: ABC transporter ATP-binding protein [Thermodesulfobacteriota bacterium]|nr:ABC transporter ATP-binding protein [Thermodesulfobacteriota bacterium]
MQDDQTLTAAVGQGFHARGIVKNFFDGSSRLEVLKGIDLEIKPGKMVAIVGTSGTGKTTLLHVLGTLDPPDQGEIYYQGENVLLRDDRGLCRFRNQTIGFVFQFHHLLPEFTAFENTIMPGLIAGRNKEELTERGHELLNKVGLAERITHKVGELSGGEQQRVALARAVIMKPALLLADEPTGNLDPKTGNKVFELIQAMNEDFNLSIIMVTHNHELAGRMDSCLTLADGHLSQE